MNRGIRAILLLLVLLGSLSIAQQNTLAEEENPYLNLTPAEASGVLNRLISNPELLQKFSEERKNQLTSAEVFRKTILAQQKDLLTRRNLSQLIVLKKLVIGFYSSDSEVRTRYEALSTFSERLEYLIATGNIESLVETRKIDSLLPEEKQLLDSSLLGYIKSSVADKLAIKKSSEALNNLILLPDDLWAAEGKSLATSIFAGMVKDEASFSSDQVERLFNRLISVVQIEPTSKPALQGIFENSTYSASDRGDKTETLKLLSQMRKFSDNKLSAPFVEELLLDHPSGLDSENAEKLIEELKQRDELSNKFKLKLMWDGYFGPLVPILIGLSIALPIIGLTIFSIVWVRRKLGNLKIDNPFKSKKTIPGYMRPIEVESRDNEDEYTRLLAMFNLSDTASENDIKKAYRGRMKVLHPDSGNIDIALENSEEFRELKHSHDRIMEIRSAWFQGRKNK